MLVDLNPGPADSNPTPLLVAGHEAYFNASGPTGVRMFATDGTSAGTHPVIASDGRKLAINLSGSGVDLRGALIFPGYEIGADGAADLRTVGIWKTDGTPAGTQFLTQFGGLAPVAAPAMFSDGHFAYINTPSITVRTDGTPDGTTVLRQADGRIDPSGTAPILGAISGRVYFAGTDLLHGTELWSTDGSVAGTHLFDDLLPGTDSSNPSGGFVYNNSLYFGASSPLGGSWRTDGTVAGTMPMTSALGLPGSFHYISQLWAFNDKFFFVADDELWQSDGTAAGTSMYAAVPLDHGLSQTPVVMGNAFYFDAGSTASGQSGIELWKSDGTPAGTRMVKDINTGPTSPGTELGSSSPGFLTVVGKTLLFTADDGIHGRALWRSDGTPNGTELDTPVNIAIGSAPYDATSPVVINDAFLFSAIDAEHGCELWEWRASAQAKPRVSFHPAHRAPSRPMVRVAGPESHLEKRIHKGGERHGR